MGSGISGNYSGITQGSQPYAYSYQVTSELLEKDKEDPDIYNPVTGYFKNPTTTNLSEAIIGDGVYMDNQRVHGTLLYVLTEDGKLLFGKRNNPNDPNKRAPHPTLVGGINPKVICAGMITFSKGKIVSVNNNSGHYKPNIKSMKEVDNYMKKLYEQHSIVFNNQSKWRKKK